MRIGTNGRRVAQIRTDANNLSGRRMIVWVRIALVMITAGMSGASAVAFSIEGVTVGPRPLTSSGPVTMTVYVLTPTAPAGLYAPTQVSRSNQNVHVDIYPTSGMVQILGSMDVVASLGTFEIGDYTYESVIAC